MGKPRGLDFKAVSSSLPLLESALQQPVERRWQFRSVLDYLETFKASGGGGGGGGGAKKKKITLGINFQEQLKLLSNMRSAAIRNSMRLIYETLDSAEASSFSVRFIQKQSLCRSTVGIVHHIFFEEASQRVFLP